MIKFDEKTQRLKSNIEYKPYFLIVENKKIYFIVKRLFDIVLSLVLLILLSLPILLISLLIKLDSIGPIIFSQVRIGKSGKEFRIYKFRTMVHSKNGGGTEITKHIDKRITNIGGILRKFRLDEIPQLINILFGEMSFVGPRPEVEKFVNCYSDIMFITLLVKPGVTSESSVKFRDENVILKESDDVEKDYIEKILPRKIELNLKSILEMSLFNDLKILFLTVFHVFILSKTESKSILVSDKNILECDDSPLVSIVMPSYNTGDYIEETILSVINQTYRNWELIIVDDNSIDNSLEVIERFMKVDSRIALFKNFKNSGAAISRTIGIKKASGEFIAFLDSDDVWYQNKLKKQLCFMIENNYTFTCTAYAHIDSESFTTGKIILTKQKANYNDTLLSCPIGNSTVIYNSSILGKFVVPNIRKRNDDALWLQILKKTPYIYGYQVILSNYRVRKNSISSNKISLIKYHWKLYREIENLGLFKSLYHIIVWIIIKMFRLK
jgi:teichuronic acid biosynthesis glycosyltransferase TuaG